MMKEPDGAVDGGREASRSEAAGEPKQPLGGLLGLVIQIHLSPNGARTKSDRAPQTAPRSTRGKTTAPSGRRKKAAAGFDRKTQLMIPGSAAIEDHRRQAITREGQ